VTKVPLGRGRSPLGRKAGRWIFSGSARPALLWGVAFANIVRGLLNAAHVYPGHLLTLRNPYGLLSGLVTRPVEAIPTAAPPPRFAAGQP
jgi:cytochrome bd-type quinol oxidase subunit 2